MFIIKPVKREMIRTKRVSKTVQLSLFEKKWPIVKASIERMFGKDLDNISFGEVYRITYELVLYNFSKDLYENVQLALEEQLGKMHQVIKNSSPAEFLSNITSNYTSYRQVLTILQNTMYYLDEIYCLGDVKKLFSLGLDLFDKHVINSEVLEQLRKEVLGNIYSDREGNEVDIKMIKAAITILDDLKSYEKVVEVPLLEATKEYYEKKATQMISEVGNVSEYIQNVQEIVVKEMDRVKKYLVLLTGPKIDSVVREAMVTKHVKFVFEDQESGFLALVAKHEVKQLGIMYFLFSKNEDQLKIMREKFKEYVFETGRKYVTSEAQKKPQEFIEHILHMKGVYDDMMTQSFDNNKDFRLSLDEGFSGFADGTIQSDMASLLSLYVDGVMKKYREGFEKYLETAISVFKYLKDQDMFENYYKIHLSKRLLISRSLNEPAEKSFISLLKGVSGYTFTAKIEGMFNDIRLSKATMEKYQKSGPFTALKKAVDVNVSTLTSSFWPQYEFSNPLLPPDMTACVSSFEKYYKSAHKSRKLTWQNNLGDGVLIARFPVSKHEVSVTTYQMILLLLFNTVNSLTFEEIVKLTAIPEREIKRNLLLLCIGKYKLLTKSPKSKTVKPEDVFGWNVDFKTNNTRLRIGNLIVMRGGIAGLNKKSGAREEGEEVNKREGMIEKALIKILRTKRRILFVPLVKRAKELLKGKIEGEANTMEIKKRIESLILREFVKRDPENRKMYEYIA